MKYYAVTDDPRELYHYGRLGMKWGKHIFGDKPKSPGYHKAAKKLKAISAKAVKSAKQTSAHVAYNARRKQDARFEKSLAKAQTKLDRADVKFDNWQKSQAEKSVVKQLNKAIRTVKINKAKANIAEIAKNLGTSAVKSTGNALRTAGSAAARAPGQISYNVRRKQEQQYQKAVEKANTRNRLSEALRSYDQDQKLYKQAERERKMDDLREKHANIMADNDLKTLKKAVKVEKHMPDYYQQARTGTLAYGKLSDEQVARLQNRLALEANTRRLGSTEEPSWRQQKKMARRQGYLQGITKGTSAAMEEVARAGAQYGIQHLMDRRKLNKASEYKAEREKKASQIKNKKSHSEIRKDFKQDVYEQRIKEGDTVLGRSSAEKLRAVENTRRERQNRIDDAREERKFLTEEKHNKIRNERQQREKLAEQEAKAKQIGESIYKYGFAVLPEYNKDGKQIGWKKIDSHDGNAGQLAKLYEMKEVKKETLQDKARKEREAKREASKPDPFQEAYKQEQERLRKKAEWDKAAEERIKEIQRQNAEMKKQKEEEWKTTVQRSQANFDINNRRNKNRKIVYGVQSLFGPKKNSYRITRG